MDSLTQKIKEIHSLPIVYHAIYTKVTGSLTAWVLLSQLVYWHKAMKRAEFYKTNQDIMNETWLWLSELKSAKKILKNKWFVSTRLKGVPAMTYYFIHIDRLLDSIDLYISNWLDYLDSQLVENQPTGWTKVDQLDGWKTTNKLDENQPTIIWTENTTEITTDISNKTIVLLGSEEKNDFVSWTEKIWGELYHPLPPPKIKLKKEQINKWKLVRDCIKQYSNFIDWDINDCYFLYAKLEREYPWDEIAKLDLIIQYLFASGLSEFYSPAKPKSIANNLWTIQIKARTQKNKTQVLDLSNQ